jgi:hypothetical protein
MYIQQQGPVALDYQWVCGINRHILSIIEEETLHGKGLEKSGQGCLIITATFAAGAITTVNKLNKWKVKSSAN